MGIRAAIKNRDAKYLLPGYADFREAYEELITVSALQSILGGGERGLADTTRDTLGQQAMQQYRANPQAAGFITTMTNFLIGPGVEVTHPDPAAQEELETFLKDNDFDTLLVEFINRYFIDGEVFPVAFVNKVTGDIALREYDPAEIKQVVTDPDDYKVIEGLYREYTRRTYKVVADSVTYDDQPKTEFIEHRQDIGNLTLREFFVWKRPTVPSETRGFSFLTPVLHYLTQFRELIKTRLNIHRALGAYAWKWILKGLTGDRPAKEGKVQAFRDILEQRGAPPPGSNLVTTEGVDVTPMTTGITAGSSGAEGDYRAVGLQIATGLSVPEFIATGDASNANFASTSVVLQAFIKYIQRLQRLVTRLLDDVFAFWLEQKLDAARISAEAAAEPCQISYPIIIPENLKDLMEALAGMVGQKIISKRKAAELSPFEIDYDAEQEQIEADAEKALEQAPGAMPFFAPEAPPVFPDDEPGSGEED